MCTQEESICQIHGTRPPFGLAEDFNSYVYNAGNKVGASSVLPYVKLTNMMGGMLSRGMTIITKRPDKFYECTPSNHKGPCT